TWYEVDPAFLVPSPAGPAVGLLGGEGGFWYFYVNRTEFGGPSGGVERPAMGSLTAAAIARSPAAGAPSELYGVFRLSIGGLYADPNTPRVMLLFEPGLGRSVRALSEPYPRALSNATFDSGTW